jgi:hypothetical protein
MNRAMASSSCASVNGRSNFCGAAVVAAKSPGAAVLECANTISPAANRKWHAVAAAYTPTMPAVPRFAMSAFCFSTANSRSRRKPTSNSTATLSETTRNREHCSLATMLAVPSGIEIGMFRYCHQQFVSGDVKMNGISGWIAVEHAVEEENGQAMSQLSASLRSRLARDVSETHHLRKGIRNMSGHARCESTRRRRNTSTSAATYTAA